MLYEDVSLLVFTPFQGNVIIVDTPGISDQTHEEEAGMMLNYVPNALTVVFVLNVANAGGMQADRVIIKFILLISI